MPEQWSNFLAHLWEYLGMLFNMSNGPAWGLLRTAACGWIAVSILRFVPEEGMRFRLGTTASATFIFIMCIMELSRVMTGLAIGVSPFISCIMIWFARLLHQAKGNVSKINPTQGAA